MKNKNMTNKKEVKKRRYVKEIEYEEAPSGSVKLYSYKEPFMKFTAGYGYQGVLLFDSESEKIQCHFCGQWFDQLGNHLGKEHNMLASEYKEQVGLLQSTALINEKIREKLIATGRNRFKNIKPGKKKSKEEIEKIRNTLKKNADNRERQNLIGTCPAQLLEKLQKEYEILGYTPRVPGKLHLVPEKYRKEATQSARRLGDKNKYIRVFGSWKEALSMANIPYRVPGSTINHRAREKSDYYSKESLIKFLINFKENHKRKPSYSDCRRNLLPELSKFTSKFGSFRKALKVAFKK